MAANKIFNFGPTTLILTTPTNILNPPTATGGVNGGTSAQFIVLRHIRIVNKTATAATFSLFRGLTGGSLAGTEVIGTATSVAANSAYDWYGVMRFDSTDFLSGFAGTTAALVIQGEGEIGVAG